MFYTLSTDGAKGQMEELQRLRWEVALTRIHQNSNVLHTYTQQSAGHLVREANTESLSHLKLSVVRSLGHDHVLTLR